MDNLAELLDKIIQDKQLRAECLPDLPNFWCDFYFHENFKTPEDYDEIIDWIEAGGNLIRFGYRGCAKTSKIRKRLCKRIAKKQNRFIRWTSYDLGKAEDNITSLSNMLIGDDESMFVYDYGRLYYDSTPFSPFKQKTQKRTSGFVSTNGVIVKANSIRKSTRGLNQFLGKKSVRPDLDILDDIDDDENTENPKTITKNLKKIKGAIFGGSTGQKIILGNTINEDGILPRLAEEYKDNKKWKIVYTKLIDDKGNIHWPERFALTDTEAEFRNIGKTGDDEKVVSIEALRAEAGRDWFGANYLLIPLRNGVPIIEEQWCKLEQYIPVTHGHKTYISIDNAESEKDGSDPIGITVGTWIPELNKWHIRYSGKLEGRNKDLMKVEEKIIRLYETFKVDGIIIENKAGGITLRKHLIQKKHGRAIYLFDPGKYTKIGRLRKVQPLLEVRSIVFDLEIDPTFITELTKFPNIPHDDRVDSFTALILYHKQFLMKIEAENQKEEDGNSIESEQKKDKPKEINNEDRISDLMNKYQKPGSARFTKDF